jgi:hypothetical protein
LMGECDKRGDGEGWQGGDYAPSWLQRFSSISTRDARSFISAGLVRSKHTDDEEK